mmetsp:Transcript_17396/g.44364  ORF Transcript_17396/g.44364 Transcript_17396/m.44364 type:complete len:1181 (-) Transcript_17396:1181-4723(-)
MARRHEEELKKAEEEMRAMKDEERKKVEEQRRIKKEREEREKLTLVEREQKNERRAAAIKYLDDATKGFNTLASAEYEFPDGHFLLRCIQPEAWKSDEEKAQPGTVLAATTILLGGQKILLHWGLRKGRRGGWSAAPEAAWPPGTMRMKDGKAVQTEMQPLEGGMAKALEIKGLPEGTSGVLAVLHLPEAEQHMQWLGKPGGGDMYVEVAETRSSLGLAKHVSKVAQEMAGWIVEREMEYGSWTLMHRYNYGSELVYSTCGSDEYAWAMMYVWMRYSQLRVLDWQRSYNTQPRQLSHAQMTFVTNLAKKYRELGSLQWEIRLAMSCVGRGGSAGNGQQIRDDILVILRHDRSWGHGSMMEDWHQKLHNNTNPDDVIICEALLVFWRGNGNIQGYRDHLNGNGVTRERMAAYQQPVRAEPTFNGHIKDTMIWELEKYGRLLRSVHLGTDLNESYDRVRGYLDGDTRAKIDGYYYARNSNHPLQDQLWAAANSRQGLMKQLKGGVNDDQARDLLFLDIALDADVRRVVESGKAYFDGSIASTLSALRATALALSLSEGDQETATQLRNIDSELDKVSQKIAHTGESHEVGLRCAAAMTNAKNILTSIIDRFHRSMDSISKGLGRAFNAETEIVDIFVEEAIRGSPAFVLSMLLRKAEPEVRRIAHLGPYSVISPFHEETTGPVYTYAHLKECQGATVPKGSVIIADVCGGDEDVPDRVGYVIIGSTVDVLSHVAVRARNEHHGLIACLDSDEMSRIKALKGSTCKAKLEGDNFHIEVVEHSQESSEALKQAGKVMKRVKSKGLITPPSGDLKASRMLSDKNLPEKASGSLVSRVSSGNLPDFESIMKRTPSMSIIPEKQLVASWAIRPAAYTTELVGSKSLNLQRLLALEISDWIHIPTSVTIPNGALKKVLNDEANAELKKKFKELRTTANRSESGDVSFCPELRKCIMDLSLPDGLAEALRGVLDELGCEDIDGSLDGTWKAVKGVWASLWNERAHLARRKLGLTVEEVDMAVLCQKVVDADYAFVIHTHNPITGDRDEIYAEVVVGLGETLVGNAPGQAMGFTVKKGEKLQPEIKSFPSKAFALKGGKYIFRSDSNAEDLEGFAGAGLHDSIPIEENHKVDIDYANEKIVNEETFRTTLMTGIARIGMEVEEVMGGFPQDIEGCYKDGEFYVVQARPQV